MRKIGVFGNALMFALVGVVSVFAQSADDKWTGYYVGGYGGVTIARPGINASTVYTDEGYFAGSSVAAVNADGTRNVDAKGFTGGGQFGYNQQYGNIVVGAEADFGSQRFSKEVSVTRTYPDFAPSTYTLTQEVKSNWIATFRPKLGVSAGNAMFYATGGLALTDVRYNSTFTDTFDDALETGEIKKTRAGYTMGGGVEVRATEQWSVKGEYLFSDFGRISAEGSEFTTSGGGSWPETVFTHAVKMKSHNVRFGVNYRF
jgi:outer membrane immunogenic protein